MPHTVSANDILVLVADADDVVFSGYYVDWEYFQILVAALRPDFPEWLESEGQTMTHSNCVAEYDSWRRQLSDEDKDRIPQLRISYDAYYKDEEDRDLVRYFFPTRFVYADLGYCAEEYPEAMTEREDDIARRDEMIALLKERHGFEADMSRVHFGCYLARHPDVYPLVAGT